MKKAIYIILFALLFISCKTTYQQSSNEEIQNETNKPYQESPPDSILSLEFYIYKNEPVDSIVLFRISKVSGYLNTDYFTDIPAIPMGKIKCSILNNNKTILKSILIDNPLQMDAEYTEGNDFHTLKKKRIELEKNYFSLRTNYTESMEFIRFEILDKNNEVYIYPIISIN